MTSLRDRRARAAYEVMELVVFGEIRTPWPECARFAAAAGYYAIADAVVDRQEKGSFLAREGESLRLAIERELARSADRALREYAAAQGIVLPSASFDAMSDYERSALYAMTNAVLACGKPGGRVPSWMRP